VNVGLITTKYANLTPERPAVVDVPNGRRMNYGELETRACKLANAALGTMASCRNLFEKLHRILRSFLRLYPSWVDCSAA
jgi:hypothetical protein